MARILVIDDEQDLCEILRFNLEAEGFEVETANSAEEALELLHGAGPQADLLLLDVMMDRMTGYELADQLRHEGNEVPIIFLTARSTEPDMLHGFASGADDYINKPFSFETVLARIKAVLKRTSRPQKTTLQEGSLRILIDDGTAWIGDSRLSPTKKEYQILLLLLQHKGQHYTREQILSEVWDDDICVGDRSVDVHIARLRKKLGPAGAHIVNRTGFGYAYYE
ncbi:MAG: response regulator transcription factor [Bacteroidales bacterium]|nr:response regulator transcription factor [Bacteroidales bacterium]